MAVILGLDGKHYDYVYYEDQVKPKLREQMRICDICPGLPSECEHCNLVKEYEKSG